MTECKKYNRIDVKKKIINENQKNKKQKKKQKKKQ